MKKTIGIMGGMGPEATRYMYDLILERTDAGTDQDHIHVIINSYPQVPPRTDAIRGEGPSPTPFLKEGIEALINAGADFVVMPCVTAHFFIPEVSKEIEFEFVSLLDEAGTWAKTHLSGIRRAGLIASRGAIEARLFNPAFAAQSIEILTPGEKELDQSIAAIFGSEGIKAGHTTGGPREAILSVAGSLIERGAEAVIAGCTEIPLVLRPEDISVPLIEPMKIAAEVCITKAGYRIKTEAQ
ncbi:MAG: amino acid racemase [Candidatus Aminicenantaceae bacterium]